MTVRLTVLNRYVDLSLRGIEGWGRYYLSAGYTVFALELER